VGVKKARTWGSAKKNRRGWKKVRGAKERRRKEVAKTSKRDVPSTKTAISNFPVLVKQHTSPTNSRGGGEDAMREEG